MAPTVTTEWTSATRSRRAPKLAAQTINFPRFLPIRSSSLPTQYILYVRPVKSSTETTLAEDDDLQTRRAIGQAARAARNALRLTQEQVADALGMAAEVYGRIERGLMMPSVSTLIGIARVLKLTPDQLLGWAEQPERTRPAAYERILAQLDRADEPTLERVDAVLSALLAPEAKK